MELSEPSRSRQVLESSGFFDANAANRSECDGQPPAWTRSTATHPAKKDPSLPKSGSEPHPREDATGANSIRFPLISEPLAELALFDRNPCYGNTPDQ